MRIRQADFNLADIGFQCDFTIGDRNVHMHDAVGNHRYAAALKMFEAGPCIGRCIAFAT